MHSAQCTLHMHVYAYENGQKNKNGPFIQIWIQIMDYIIACLNLEKLLF